MSVDTSAAIATRLVCLLVASVLVSSCTVKRKASSEPIEQDPVKISGTNIIKLRPSCLVSRSETLTQEVSCRVVLQTPSQEVVLSEKQPDLTINWDAPSLLSGSEFTVVSSRTMLSGLRFDAVVQLTQSSATQIEFAFNSALSSGQTFRATQAITVPFSVRTYGFTAQLRDVFSLDSNGIETPPSSGSAGFTSSRSLAVSKVLKTTSGLVPMSYPVEHVPFYFVANQLSPLCFLRGKTYIASIQNIFVIDDNKVRVFAGKLERGADYRGVTEFTDPFQVSLGTYPAIACSEGKNKSEDRIYAAFSMFRVDPNPANQNTAYPLTIASFTPTGQVKVVSNPTVKQSSSSVALAPNGDLYVFEVWFDRVRLAKMTPDGAISSVNIVDPPTLVMPPTATNFDQGSIAIDSTGAIYLSVTQNNRIYRLEPDGKMKPVIGNGATHAAGVPVDTSQPANLVAINLPKSIVARSNGSLLIAETGGDQILEWNPTTNRVSRFLGQGSVDLPTELGALDAALVGSVPKHRITMPPFLALSKDALWFAPNTNILIEGARLYRVTFDGNQKPKDIRLQMSSKFNNLEDGDDFRASTSLSALETSSMKKLRYISSVRFNNDRFCVLDATNSRVFCVGEDNRVQVVAGNMTTRQPSHYNYTQPVSAVGERLNNLKDFAFGPDGSMFITSPRRHVIFKVTPDGKIQTIAGFDSGLTPIYPETDPTTLLEHPEILVGPSSIDVDSAGNVYFSDQVNSNEVRATFIKKLTPSPTGGYTVTRIAGSATNGTGLFKSFDDVGEGLNSLMMPVSDVRVTRSGEIFVSAPSRSQTGYIAKKAHFSGGIFKVTASGYTTIAGGFNADSDAPSGPALKAYMSPLSFEIAPNGDIYFNEYLRAVRRISLAGDGTYHIDTLASQISTEERCGGGVKEGTGDKDLIEQKWKGTLNSICLGNLTGIAIKNTCTASGDFTLLFSQEFDGLGSSILVEAKRSCF